MEQPPPRFSRTLWIGVGLLIVILAFSFVLSRPDAPRHRVAPLPVLGQLTDFALTNQAGQLVRLADLGGKVWVADIIFTRCAGPCPIMTQRMKSLQDALPASSHARLVTLTTDPDHDSPAVLKAYAQRFQADPERWTFLTGTKVQIAALAIDGLKLTAVEKQAEQRENADDLFIHSTIFVLVDKHARLRGIFETTGEGLDWEGVKEQILGAVRRLEREP